MADLEHIEPGYVYLNGTRFKLKTPVSPVVLSTPPPVSHSSNDPDKSETILDTFIHPDGRAGIGLFKILEADQVNYSWFSTCYSYRNNVALPEEVVTLTPPPISSPGLERGFDYGNFVYEIWNSSVYQRNPVTLGLGAAIQALGGPSTDVVVYNFGGSLFVWIAANGVLWKVATDPSVAGNYTNTGLAAKFLLVWDNKLIRVDANNHVFATTDNGATWTAAGAIGDIPTQVGWVQGLFVYFDPLQNIAPYASTRLGAFFLDYSTGLWHQTKLTTAPQPNAGLGFGDWHNDLYMSAGLDVYHYVVNVIATVSNSGLNQFDGVPPEMNGSMTRFALGNSELYALLDSTASGALVGAVYNGGSQFGIANPFTWPAVPTATGYTSIVAWNGARWRVVWRSGANGLPANGMFITQAGSGIYRLVWGTNQNAYYIDIPQTIVNPLQDPAQRFQPMCQDTKPWFNAQMFGRKKLGVVIVARASHTSPQRTITLEYGLDLAEPWYPARDFQGNINNVISTDGITEFTFEPNLTGQPYDWLRLRATLASNDPTQTPRLEYVGHYFADIPRQRWGFTFGIEIDDSAGGGKTAQMQEMALRALLPDANDIPQLARMQFRSAQTDVSQDMRVLIYRVVGTGSSGNDYRGTWQLSVGRVYP